MLLLGGRNGHIGFYRYDRSEGHRGSGLVLHRFLFLRMAEVVSRGEAKKSLI